MAQIQSKEFKSKSGIVIQIRSAIPSDAAKVLACYKEVMVEQIYTLTTPDELSLTEEQEAAWIQSLLENPSALLLVAVYRDEIIGMIDLSPGHRKRIAHTGEIGLSISKAYRGAGIGDALLSTVLDWVASHPILEKVNLKVHASNTRALKLYEKQGFQVEGRQVKDLKYGPHEYVDTLLMGKFLK